MIGSLTRAPNTQQSGPTNMDSDLGPPRPSPPPTLSQPPQETEQRLHGDRDTWPKFVIFREDDASIASTSTACAGASSSPLCFSNEPYRVMIREPINSERSETSRACACAGNASHHHDNEPFVTIVEQPQNNKRFRYDSEITSAGAIHGVKSGKNDQKTFPTIKIWNYEGFAIITVSLVCVDYPYRVHPNGLVGKKKTSNTFTYIYVRHVQVTKMNCTFQFDDLGIRMVKPEQVNEALKLREEQKVDPFNQGYSKKVFSKNDLQKVRLCFHVELVSLKRLLPPVVSDVIYDSNKLGCLQIKVLCDCSGSEKGGPRIILVCGRLNPKDVEVVFYEEENGIVVWQQTVKKMEVYGCTTIVCEVPAYTRAAIEYDKEVQVNIKLRRPSNGSCGDPRPFTYYADNKNSYYRKKRKMTDSIIQKYVKEKWTPDRLSEADFASLTDQDWRKTPQPGPFDTNSAAPMVPKPRCVSTLLTKSSECREPMQSNIPMSPDMEPMPSSSEPMSEAEDELQCEYLTENILDAFDPMFFENLDI